ncbi:TorF family putative porin [Luteimonas sp. A611]
MRLAKTSLLLALAALPGIVLAQDADGGSAWSVEGEIAATSDYVWRGLTQTDGKPALMGEITVSHESGFYAGAWAGSADTGDSESGIDHEIDLYLGWAGELAEDVELDLSVTRVKYPGVNEGYELDYTEFAAALSFAEYYTVGVAYSPDIVQFGEQGIYYSAAAEYPLGDSGFGFKLSSGWYDLDDAAGDSYGNWLVGVTRSFGPIDAELHYTNTFSYGEALSENFDDAEKADGRVALRLAWGF